MFLSDNLITLRAIEIEDSPLLFEMINDPEVEATVLGWSYPVSNKQQIAWIENARSDDKIRYAIDAGNGIVGTAIISSIDHKNKTANLNIKVSSKERGKGYAAHAVSLMINYSFNELNLNCLTANILEDNSKSRALFEKRGFKQDGVLRERVYKQGKYKNVIAYSLLKSEWGGDSPI